MEVLTSGVTRIASKYVEFDVDLESAKLKTMGQWDPRQYLNVWVVQVINSEIMPEYKGRTWWSRKMIGGYGTLPTSIITSGNFLDGVVVAGVAPNFLVHEVGHYLGLLHTWEGGCLNDDCVFEWRHGL